jgi:hypothetical protein
MNPFTIQVSELDPNRRIHHDPDYRFLIDRSQFIFPTKKLTQNLFNEEFYVIDLSFLLIQLRLTLLFLKHKKNLIKNPFLSFEVIMSASFANCLPYYLLNSPMNSKNKEENLENS